MKYILFHLISSDATLLQVLVSDYVIHLENLRKDKDVIIQSYGDLDDLFLNVPLRNFITSPKLSNYGN